MSNSTQNAPLDSYDLINLNSLHAPCPQYLVDHYKETPNRDISWYEMTDRQKLADLDRSLSLYHDYWVNRTNIAIEALCSLE